MDIKDIKKKIDTMQIVEMDGIAPVDTEIVSSSDSDWTYRWYLVNSKEDAELLFKYYEEHYYNKYCRVNYARYILDNADFSKPQYISIVSNGDIRMAYVSLLTESLNNLRTFINKWRNLLGNKEEISI